MTVLLSKALQEGKALVMDEGTKWNYDACDGLGYECHFQPLSACQAAQAAAAGTPLHRRADEIRYEHPDAHDSHFVPAEWRGYTHGVLWWRAQLTGFLLRPQERLRARLRQVKNMIGFSHPVVGLQVRRGDSCEHASSSAIRPGCAPLDKYAELVLAMAARYQVRLVFLATDDAEAVRYLRAACAKEGLEVITLSVDRNMFESSLFIEYRLMLGYVDKAAVADSTMLEHRETTRFFEIFDDVHAQPHTSRFTYRRAAFFNTLKSKIGLMVARAAALRTNINIDDRPLPTKKRRRTSSKHCARGPTSFMLVREVTNHKLI